MSSKKHILNLGEDLLDDYHTIAIQTALEDYRLAFHLNKNLTFNFERFEDNIIYFDKKEFLNPRHYYSFNDQKQFIEYFLIQNKHLINEEQENMGLFSKMSTSTETYFSKVYKKVDFFLIIKGEDISKQVEEVLETLKGINLINSTFLVQLNQLKTNNYLLFNH